MYLLRKEPYQTVIPGFQKTDGTIIPERVHEVGDRAIYKHNNFSRFYRDSYPIPRNTGIKLYKVKKLSTILRIRDSMFEYCGELFDVYDENGKVQLKSKD